MSESSDSVKRPNPKQVVERSGMVYGRLTALSKAPHAGRGTAWLCLCSCGKETVVTASNLHSGHTRSCGCFSVETAAAQGKKNRMHGLSKTVVHNAWVLMKERCGNPNKDGFARYGGRGIKVCAEWDQSFDAFFRDVGDKPSRQHSLDRIDVNGNYEPGNVRWATAKQQANNRTDNVFIEFDGERLTVAQAAEKYGFGVTTLRRRLKSGHSVKSALTTPLHRRTWNTDEA